MLDLLDNRDSPVVGLDFVTKKPLPFPPEPLALGRYPAAPAGHSTKKTAPAIGTCWLRGLDRVGLGFDS